MANRLQARFAPTLVFLDAHGNEVAERLIGATSPEFYGGLLQQRLEAARAALSSR